MCAKLRVMRARGLAKTPNDPRSRTQAGHPAPLLGRPIEQTPPTHPRFLVDVGQLMANPCQSLTNFDLKWSVSIKLRSLFANIGKTRPKSAHTLGPSLAEAGANVGTTRARGQPKRMRTVVVEAPRLRRTTKVDHRAESKNCHRHVVFVHSDESAEPGSGY